MVYIDTGPNWIERLAGAIEGAEDGATIYVATEDQARLAERAAMRMKRTDLTFIVGGASP